MSDRIPRSEKKDDQKNETAEVNSAQSEIQGFLTGNNFVDGASIGFVLGLVIGVLV